MKIAVQLVSVDNEAGKAQATVNMQGIAYNGELILTEIAARNLCEYAYYSNMYEFNVPEEYIRREFDLEVRDWYRMC